MKIVVLNESKKVVLALRDEIAVNRLSEKTEISIPDGTMRYFVEYCNKENSTIYTDITLPSDFLPGRYLFDGSVWTREPSINGAQT